MIHYATQMAKRNKYTGRFSKAKSFRAELWQGGMMVAAVEGSDKESVEREINHYAVMYGQDGPVAVIRKAMRWLFYRLLYRPLMRTAHRFHWHYAPPIYPEGDTHLWCKWCGFRQTIKRAGDKDMVSR